MNSIKKSGLFLLMMLLTVTSVLAQSSINGNITDQAGDPVPGVNVILDGTAKGAITDFDGNFTIANVSDGDYVLKATSLGFEAYTQNVSLAGNDVVLSIALAEDAESLDEIIITGVVNPKSRLESSISVSTMSAERIEIAAPRSAGELFRNIPGIRAESSGGDGNANFSVRGVPTSDGGSRYFQIQEDGLPLNLFGDTAFANSDNFLRIDSNIGRVEAVRGGSASTQASNAPAGIINMISKTGAVEGGSIATTFGVDYQTNRLDFEYGTPLGNGLSYHIGGFMRTGEGPRALGYQGNKGGQLKANLTKKFENGYVRTYVKILNDRSAMYLPMPVLLEGSDADPTFSNLPGFDITSDAQHSVYLQEAASTSALDGTRKVNDVRNGNNAVSQSVGVEFSFNLPNDWKLSGKARYANNSGEWVSPFSAGLGTVAAMEAKVRGYNSNATGDLVYANGAREAFNPSNGLAQIIHMFDVSIDDLSNFISDVKVTKKLGDKVGFTAGMFSATQNTKTSWQWSSFLSEVKGGGQARLADIDGFSRNGQFAYGTPEWGNCCQRKYNYVQNINAPYVGIDAQLSEKLNFDGSLRFENVSISGIDAGNGPTRVGAFDYDGSGTIEGIEQNVPITNGGDGNAINDSFNYASYSAGLNYKLNDGAAIFTRFSSGGSARAPGRTGVLSNGTTQANYDQVAQFELGYKRTLKNGILNITAFNSSTEESEVIELNRTNPGRTFTAMGLEVDAALAFGDHFRFNGSFTWMDAEIEATGNTPRRQADFVYNLAPTYSFGNQGQHLIALSILGTTKSFAQDDNVLVMPGYAYFNLVGKIGLTDGLSLVLSANNLFDTVGITEVEGVDGAFGSNRLARARSISGRSTTLSLQYKF